MLTALHKTQFIFPRTLWDRQYIYSPFTDVETEAQSDSVTNPRCPSCSLQGKILSLAVWLQNLVLLLFFLTTQWYCLMPWYFTIVLTDCCLRYHTLLGTYGVADLQTLSSSDMLATSLQDNFLHLAKTDGVGEHCNMSVQWKHVTYIHIVLLKFLFYGKFQAWAKIDQK